MSNKRISVRLARDSRTLATTKSSGSANTSNQTSRLRTQTGPNFHSPARACSISGRTNSSRLVDPTKAATLTMFSRNACRSLQSLSFRYVIMRLSNTSFVFVRPKAKHSRATSANAARLTSLFGSTSTVDAWSEYASRSSCRFASYPG